MIRIYFVRHAESDKNVSDDRQRPLTLKGMEDTSYIHQILKDKGIDVAICSPYKRSLDTIKGFTDHLGIPIKIDERFRERGAAVKGQGLRSHPERWKATDWKEEWGESISKVEERNIQALMEVLEEYDGHNIIIGTHGTAFSTILAHLSSEYGYDDFLRMMDWMPNIVEIVFDHTDVVEINELGHIERKY